jgi:hypothetical protein
MVNNFAAFLQIHADISYSTYIIDNVKKNISNFVCSEKMLALFSQNGENIENYFFSKISCLIEKIGGVDLKLECYSRK